MKLLLSPSIKTLIRTGRYSIVTPETKDDKTVQPTIISIFYLDGDLLNYIDEDKLDKPVADFDLHRERIRSFLNEIKKPFKYLEYLASAISFILSFIALYLSEIDILINAIVTSFIGILITRFRRPVIQFIARFFTRKLARKFRGEI